MYPRRIHILPLLLAVIGFGLLQQAAPPAVTYHDQLGFALMPGANSSPVSWYIVRTFDDPARAATATNITKGEFMAIGVGWGESSANPNRENLFDKHEVANCGYHNDTIIHRILYKGGLACTPVDDLWRLGYSDYPYGPSGAKDPKKTNVLNPDGPGPGWARNPISPSEGQTTILQGYGVKFFNDIIYGENLFRLLRDMQDNDWVARYKSS